METVAWISSSPSPVSSTSVASTDPSGSLAGAAPAAAREVGEQLVHRSGYAIASIARAQSGDSPLREPVRRKLRAEIAAALVGIAHPGDEILEYVRIEACR